MLILIDHQRWKERERERKKIFAINRWPSTVQFSLENQRISSIINQLIDQIK